MPTGPETARAALAARREGPTAPTQVVARPAMGSFDPNNTETLRYLGLNPSNPKDRAMVTVAQHYGLDPMMKHVVVIPSGGVYITRDGYIEIAHRSGQFNGLDVSKPTLSEDGEFWEVQATVWRKDMSHPFTFWGRYPVAGKNKEYAPEMAIKCAESHALRRAFNVTGLGSAEERFTEDRYAVSEATPNDADAEAEYAEEPRDAD